MGTLAKGKGGTVELAKEPGSGAPVICYYAGKKYSPGSRLCQAKKMKVCSDQGKWTDASPSEDC